MNGKKRFVEGQKIQKMDQQSTLFSFNEKSKELDGLDFGAENKLLLLSNIDAPLLAELLVSVAELSVVRDLYSGKLCIYLFFSFATIDLLFIDKWDCITSE